MNKKIFWFLIPIITFVLAGESFFRIRHFQVVAQERKSSDSELKHINQLGFRGPEVSPKIGPNTIRLTFIGESTTYCPLESIDSLTWPAIVCRKLHERYPKLNFEYVNCSMPGNLLSDINRRGLYELRKVEHNVIIIMQGFNDLSTSSKKKAESMGLKFSNQKSKSLLEQHSELYCWVQKNFSITLLQLKELAGKNQALVDIGDISKSYDHEFEYLVGATDSISSLKIIMTLSSKVHGLKNIFQKIRNGEVILYHFPFLGIKGFETGIAAYNNILRTYKDSNTYILENSLTGNDNVYFDALHYNSKGNTLIAELIVSQLTQLEQFKSLIKTL